MEVGWSFDATRVESRSRTSSRLKVHQYIARATADLRGPSYAESSHRVRMGREDMFEVQYFAINVLIPATCGGSP